MQAHDIPNGTLEASVMTIEEIAYSAENTYHLVDVAFEMFLEMPKASREIAGKEIDRVSVILSSAYETAKRCVRDVDNFLHEDVAAGVKQHNLEKYEVTELKAVVALYEKHRLAWEALSAADGPPEDCSDSKAMLQMAVGIATFPVVTEVGMRKKAQLVLESEDLFLDIFENPDCSLRRNFLRTIAAC